MVGAYAYYNSAEETSGKVFVYYGSVAVEETCPTIEHALTYNAYPTCGVAICVGGYRVSNGVCVVSGGGYTPEPSIGNGANTNYVEMGKIKTITDINSSGVNILFYINSQANFNTLISGARLNQFYSLKIVGLDMIKKIVTLVFSSESVTLQLDLGQVKRVDLDRDGIKDLEVKFSDLLVNRVEITAKNIVSSSLPENTTTSARSLTEFKFNKNLSLGSVNNDVKELQRYLNSQGFMVAKIGPGSLGKETTVFGSLTKQALIKFQKTNNINPAVGYFGPVTRERVNKIN
jgi:hypothetical protein